MKTRKGFRFLELPYYIMLNVQFSQRKEEGRRRRGRDREERQRGKNIGKRKVWFKLRKGNQ